MAKTKHTALDMKGMRRNAITSSSRKQNTKSKTITKSTRAKQRKTPEAKVPFRLLHLPPEIVDMIYVQMLRAGDISILATSREVHARASQLVQSNSVCRLTAERPHNYSYYRLLGLGIRKAKSITDCEIRIAPTGHVLDQKWRPCDLSCTPGIKCVPPRAIRVMRNIFDDDDDYDDYRTEYLNRPTRRNSCRVIIEAYMNQEEFLYRSDSNIFENVIPLLVEFEEVTVVYRLPRPDQPQPIRRSMRHSAKAKKLPTTSALSSDDLEDYDSLLRETYDNIKDTFGEHLGPGTLVNDELNFSPWKNTKAAREEKFGPDEEWE